MSDAYEFEEEEFSTQVNGRTVRRLAAQLTRVQPEVRARLAELATALSQKSATAAAPQKALRAEVASQPSEQKQR